MTELVRYEAARRALAEAVAVDEVLQIHDEWEAIRLAGKVARDMELQIHAAKIRFRAERRLGELVREQKKSIGLAKGGQPYQSEREQVDRPATLAEAGIDRKLSARAQRIAGLAPADFERAIEHHEAVMRSLKGRVSMDLTRIVADEQGAEHRRNLARTLSDASSQLAPSGRKYPVIYADPAWRRHQGVTDRSYENHYPTVTWDEICALPIAQMVLPDAWLFLWIPRAHAFALHEIDTEVEVVGTGEIVRARVAMPLGYAVSKSWGFDSYSTLAVWTKTDADHPDVAGTGKIFRDQDELLLLFKRGQGLPMPEKKFGSNHRERPREHSRKPDFFRGMIASMAGGLPVLELFARVDAEHPLPEGWGAWGNQAGVSAQTEFPAPTDVSESSLEGDDLAELPSGETEAAAAEVTSDGASTAAAVAEPRHDAGDVIVIEQLAGSDWLQPPLQQQGGINVTTILPHQTIPPHAMRRVILESPFAGDIKANVDYARACIRDSLLRGEAPVASHLLYTQPGVLNDDDRNERAHGINAGHAWMYGGGVRALVVYIDRGISSGMEAGIRTAEFLGLPVERRSLDGGAA